MNHPSTFIKSTAWRYFVHWSLWMFTLDEMRIKTAFTPFALDESSAMYIQSVNSPIATTSTKYRGQEHVELYAHFTIHFHYDVYDQAQKAKLLAGTNIFDVVLLLYCNEECGYPKVFAEFLSTSSNT